VASTNAVAIKKALVALLAPALADVRVDYAYDGKRIEREYVYLGRATGPHAPLVFRAGGRLPRREELTITLHVEVRLPAALPEETDERAVRIGDLIEESIADDPQMGGTVPGLLSIMVSHSELLAGFVEDGVSSSASLPYPSWTRRPP
jgi:hypothetical protein